uniref:Uncharacterized protein LOC111136719 n=1 Tax=Crassostrea virginica TaxID=6565 RepID=A0A8B8EUZ5_CRAVI|nr:uncharacterized protein LOC111136719 [Crassostrea virginica]
MQLSYPLYGFLLLLVLQSLTVRALLQKDCHHDGLGTKPYYIGTTHLQCMLITGVNMLLDVITTGRKRRALQVQEIDMSHSYLSYDGVLMEFGLNGTRIEPYGRPMFSQNCPSSFLPTPAGFSTLPTDCVIRCAKNYHVRFGNYKPFSNNCNTFTNRMSTILCHEVYCPPWCL